MDLVVVGFQDKYRAAQVLLELRQKTRRVFDLDQAISITWEDRRNFIVQQSVNLTGEAGSGWVHLWGAFIGATLFQPFTERLAHAASEIRVNKALPQPAVDREWWIRDVGISDEFVRDVGALVRPGDSAIISVAEKFDPTFASSEMQVWGGSILYTSLTEEQAEKVRRALGG